MKYWFNVKNEVSGETFTVLAYDKFSAINIIVGKQSFKYLQSQYKAKKI